MKTRLGRRLAVALAFCIAAVTMPAAAEEPKHGGTLTYLIPTDSPPSFDGHREWTFATAHTATPFYSVLIQVNPENLSSMTDIVCDLCTEVPDSTDKLGCRSQASITVAMRCRSLKSN